MPSGGGGGGLMEEHQPRVRTERGLKAARRKTKRRPEKGGEESTAGGNGRDFVKQDGRGGGDRASRTSIAPAGSQPINLTPTVINLAVIAAFEYSTFIFKQTNIAAIRCFSYKNS